MAFFQFVLFLLIAFIGAYVGRLLRLPMGSLIGAMFAVGLSKNFLLLAFEPSKTLSFFIQVLLGLMLGLTFIKLEKEQLKKISFSLIVITVGVMTMTFGTGVLINLFTDLDINTSILSTAPGGIGEMATAAQALSLNAPIVTILQLSRVIIIMAILPIILQYIHKKIEKEESFIEPMD
jgi:membrane AbrB-like protein